MKSPIAKALVAALSLTSIGYAAGMPNMPVPVYTTKVNSISYQPALNATGTLVAQQGITVKAEASGRITQMFFESGQFVKQGDPLIQVFPDIIAAQLRANQAALALSQATYVRYKDLFSKNVVSQADLDTAAANFNKDEAAVSQSQAQLSQTLIKAPFSGYLGIRKVNLGDYITVGQDIVNLQDTDPMYVDFSVPEGALEKVKVGQRITISSDAYGSQQFVGQVSAVESLVDPNTRTLQVRATLPNPNHQLMPGVFVEVNLYVAQASQSVSIPQTSVVYSPQGDYVYRVINNKAVKTLVSLGDRSSDNIYITKGLSNGDVIVTAGQMKLQDGSTIIAANENSDKAPS